MNGGFVVFDLPHRLKEQNRADVFIALHSLQFCGFLKGIALIYGILHQFAPSGGATKDLDRHLDHILSLQFPSGDAVQNVGGVGLAVRCGGELHYTGRMKAVEDVERQSGPGIVRLVDDHHRAVHCDQVFQRAHRISGLGIDFHFGLTDGGYIFEEGRQCAVAVFVDPQSVFVVAPESLKCGNDDTGMPGDIGNGQRQGGVDIAYHDIMKLRVQRLPIGVLRVAQRGDGLGQDRIRRNKPQHHGAVGMLEIPDSGSDRFARHDGFAAACGDAQTNIRYGGEVFLIDFMIWTRLMPCGVIRGELIKRSFGRTDRVAGIEIFFQRPERALLILFQTQIKHRCPLFP